MGLTSYVHVFYTSGQNNELFRLFASRDSDKTQTTTKTKHPRKTKQNKTKQNKTNNKRNKKQQNIKDCIHQV